MKKIIFLLAILSSLNVFAQDRMVYLQNQQLRAGFLPEVGGRMVFLAPAGAPNFLLSDSSLWNEPLQERMVAKAEAPFKPYNGFITWVGPQSAWWTKQDLLPAKKQRADVWPPDPFLIYGNFKIVESNDTLLVLEGEGSPVSGVKLTKRYVLDGLQLHISVIAKNIREEEMSWDLWSNARFDAFTRFRVPVAGEQKVRIKAENHPRFEAMKHQIHEGYFSFLPEQASEARKQRVSKAFIHPAEGRMVVEKLPWILNIRFDMVPPELIHPEQALVEVYNNISANPAMSILELEHHSAYQKLSPGETMQLNETWTFEPIVLK
ncbi:MAG: DUF4380 domain-containing protein [Prolixibacteraceae bacterium]|nr:DUF4380 domain-containing protein [Prolixibacteraceae bacterium]